MWLFHSTKKFSNFFGLASYTLEERKNPKLLATLVWSIWYHKTLVQTNNKHFLISQVVPSASQTLRDFFFRLYRSQRHKILLCLSLRLAGSPHHHRSSRSTSTTSCSGRHMKLLRIRMENWMVYLFKGSRPPRTRHKKNCKKRERERERERDNQIWKYYSMNQSITNPLYLIQQVPN